MAARFAGKIILLCTLLVVFLMTMLSLRTNRHPRDQQNIDTMHAKLPSSVKHRNSPGAEKAAVKPPHPIGIHVAHPGGIVDNHNDLSVNDGFMTSDNSNGVISQNDRNNASSGNVSVGDSQGVFSMPFVPGENVVSMSLYGTLGRYTMGAIRNAELIKENFPGWKLRIYTGNPSDSRHEALPSNVMKSLRALGADIYLMEHHEDYIPPMMWRFLVADDLWVDRFIVRDSDARLTQRDAAAVYSWLQSDAPFTCVRDHPSHAGFAVSGGLWGGNPKKLRNILRRSWRDLMRGVPSHYLQDMSFLQSVIWPKVQNHSYCVDSVSCDQWPGSHPFPVPRYGYEHVGQVVNDHDLGRPQDLQILRNARVNKKCVPTNS